MKKYILLIGVAGVALGSYAAYAGNSATMTVTATIAHDVSLTITGDINLGTITINPAYSGNDVARWTYSYYGDVTISEQGALVSVPDINVGTFTANMPDPTACNGSNSVCGLDFYSNESFFGNTMDNNCDISVKYVGSNNFKVYPTNCFITDLSVVPFGLQSQTLYITYAPS